MAIKIKRAYEDKAIADGYRVLVDRLWPRGVKKTDAHVDVWLKELAPSTELRKWFNHEPEKWTGFLKKYKAELHDSGAFEQLKALKEKHSMLTLVYAAKDEEYNNAEALLEFLK